MSNMEAKSYFKQCGCMILAFIMMIVMYIMFVTQNNNIISNLYSPKKLNSFKFNSNHTNHYHTFSKPCKLIADGWLDSTFYKGIFPYYTKDVFDITFNQTQKRGTRNFIIQSKVDIDNGVEHNFRFSIGNELCSSGDYAPNQQMFGNHSILISHWYYDQKKDGHLSYWTSLDPQTIFCPIYMPAMFSPQFFTDYEHDILPVITNYANYTNLWNERQLMIAVIHSVHTKYRRGLNYFYTETITNNSNYTSFVKIIRKWHIDNTKGQYLNTKQYRSVLMRSKFVACVAGNNAESLRIWETLAMSSIPVLAVKHQNYLRRRCSFSYNGFLLFPNMTMKDIENNGLIWNEHWFFTDLDSSKLLQLNESQQFVPAILLTNDYDLEPFLQFVAFNERHNTDKSKTFWNLFQKLMNEWFLRYIEHKMYKVKELMVSRMFPNCSIM